MRSQIRFTWFVALFAAVAVNVCLSQIVSQKEQPSLSFAGVKFFHRWSKDDQHEYTPAGQDDLKAWKDMVTIDRYPAVKDGEALASTANSVLETYKVHKAQVLKTSSVPRTADKQAEHLIVVLFPRPDFIEAVFARFRMHEDIGIAIIVSHRIYGKKAGNAMSDWLKKNGRSVESKLMLLDQLPHR